MNVIHRPAGEGQHNQMIDGDHVAKASVKDAHGAFEVFEVIAPGAPMAPPHASPWTGVLFVLEGQITAAVDGTSYDVSPGGLVVVPADTPATFAVIGQRARLLMVTTGDSAGQFFADFSHSVPADRPIEQSIEAILAVTARHGVNLANS
jgi:quercetin dioxygenase-like cupin family protein